MRKYCSAARLWKVWDMYPSMRRACTTKKAIKRFRLEGGYQEMALISTYLRAIHYCFEDAVGEKT